MRKEPKSKVLGVVEGKLDLSDPQIVEALQGPRGLKGESVKGDSIKGDPGKKGDKSTEPGPQGPGPTKEQIDKAVADYLKPLDLKGAKGDKANDPDRQYLKALIQEVLADKLGG